MSDSETCGTCLFLTLDIDFPVFGQCGKTGLFQGKHHFCDRWVLNPTYQIIL